MPVNPIFHDYGTETETSLMNDLVVESIQITGRDMYYLPRTIYDKNPVFGEDPQSYFTKAITIEMYIQNVESFEGDGNFLSKFGLEIRDRIVLECSITRFQELIGNIFGLERPNEGDLIYFPLNKKVFEVRYVDPWDPFYALGTLYKYRLTCELFEFSSEKFTTGIDDIDNIENFSEDLFQWAIKTEDGRSILTEDGNVLVVDNYNSTQIDRLDDGDFVQQHANNVLDISESNPYIERI